MRPLALLAASLALAACGADGPPERPVPALPPAPLDPMVPAATPEGALDGLPEGVPDALLTGAASTPGPPPEDGP